MLEAAVCLEMGLRHSGAVARVILPEADSHRWATQGRLGPYVV